MSLTENMRNTLLEMLEDRKYIVDKAIEHNNFITKLENGIYYNHKDSNKKIYIKLIVDCRLKPNTVRDYLKKILNSHIKKNKENEVIFITKEKINNSINKLIDDYNNVDFININRLQFNITRHSLVPKHTKISNEEERCKFLSKNN